MDDRQIGTALRSIRIRRNWTQATLALKSGVSRGLVGGIERGRIATVSVATVRAIADALDARVVVTVRWQGGDLDRLINARHGAIHDAVAGLFDAMDGWVLEPEVSFSIYGERGVIDILAWHPGRRALLVIELKTDVVDVNDLMGSVDRKRRLAERIALDRGWRPASVSTWVAIADVRTNRRAVARFAATLRAKFPADGRTMRGWLRDPVARIDALGFVSFGRPRTLTNGLAPIRGVRPRRPAA
jgi:transcriptional regulator with XRE-family HTH domain